jgi:hypothetical protein
MEWHERSFAQGTEERQNKEPKSTCEQAGLDRPCAPGSTTPGSEMSAGRLKAGTWFTGSSECESAGAVASR